jgi:peptide/nickel transport system permease protein
VTTDILDARAVRTPRSSHGIAKSILARPSGAIALAAIAFVAFLAIFGPYITPYGPFNSNFKTLLGPSAQHLLGTDYLGRDVLSRLLYGSTLSILGAVEAVFVGLVLGVVPGVMSVFLGRAFEWVSLRLIDTLVALPALVFAVAVTALIGNGISEAMFVVGILLAPHFFRIARAVSLEVTGQPYVQAALLMGASAVWVVRKHVLGKVMPSLLIAVAINSGYALIAVSSLTFLGIGVQPPEPTWGGLVASDLLYLSQKPYAPIFPSALIVMTVAALNLLADTIRDAQRQGAR